MKVPTNALRIVAGSVLAAGLLAASARAEPLKVGGKPGPLKIGQGGIVHGNRPGPVVKAVRTPGYRPGGYGGGYRPVVYGGYAAAAGIGLAAGAALAGGVDPEPDDACYVIVRRYPQPDGSVLVRHIHRCD